jgi:uncharacterized membrane protein YfcA
MLAARMTDPVTIGLSCLGVLFIGLSKAGFGTGLGMLTTPLCTLAFGAAGQPPSFALGTLLPLLCAGDAFSLYHYWGKWDRRNLVYLLPGVVVGVVVGAHLMNRFSSRQLNAVIGLLAVLFVVFQVARDYIFRAEGVFRPNALIGLPFGLGTGLTSTFAHGAGPVVSMFLVPQRLAKETYVGTTVLIFTWVNWIKVPFFVQQGVITRQTLWAALLYLPLVPMGVWLGLWLNRKFSEELFLKAVYAITLLTGLQLLLDFNLARLLR